MRAPAPQAPQHYQVRPYFGRWAVVYPLPGGQWGDWAALTEFRTELGARDHAAWLNAGRTGTHDGRTPRDPAVELLLLGIRQRMGLRPDTPTAQPQETPR